MPGVVRAPSHSINSVNDFAKISYLYVKGERYREFSLLTSTYEQNPDFKKNRQL